MGGGITGEAVQGIRLAGAGFVSIPFLSHRPPHGPPHSPPESQTVPDVPFSISLGLLSDWHVPASHSLFILLLLRQLQRKYSISNS